MKNRTTWNGFLESFDTILKAENPSPPYDSADYFDYVKLNHSRLHRWLKKGQLEEELIQKIQAIDQPQTWYLIVEPWCGDAAHSSPFIYLLSELNPKISLEIVWRDTEPFMIDDYLTNGGKSIPKLVVRDENENDLYTWGPRPAACQKIYEELKEEGASFEKTKIELQKWYNQDKGKSLQEEFLKLIP